MKKFSESGRSWQPVGMVGFALRGLRVAIKMMKDEEREGMLRMIVDLENFQKGMRHNRRRRRK